MPAATANRLLPILGAIVLLMCVTVVLKSCGTDPQSAAVLESVPSAPAPDADTPADTIKTLTANVAAMTSEVDGLRQENAQLARENQTLINSRTQIEENVASRLRRELLSREKGIDNQARIDAGVLSSLTARVDRLAESLAQAQTARPNPMPVGLGLDGLQSMDETSTALVWIEPLDRPTGETASPTRLSRAARTAGGYLDRASTQTWETAAGAREAVPERQPEPAYTVPRNATLMGSTAMTALIGRVPVQGQVRDPMPFKVITGADNLAANGLTVPGVRGMIWSGTAVGDWTLSCVTGQLESVTFVFDDGTIRTVSRDDPTLWASGQGGQGGQGRRDAPLGWISDAQGMPCISGERKTNAPAFLTQRIGVQAIQAAAEAAAAAETTAVIGNAGGVTGAVTGDVGRYVLGRTASGGSEEITQWLLERQSQSFDAVFVPAGADIAIHVDRELTIDWDPYGRKLDHVFNPTASQHALRHSSLD